MTQSVFIQCGRMPLFLRALPMSCALFVCCCLSTAWSAEDAYLDQLDQEVAKVEASSSDKASDGGGESRDNFSSDTPHPVASRDNFESLLRRQHVGTYSFYRRLPERSREEIFLDYSNGASMEALRGKIIDRYLHP
ncbi:MAG: hypothetical protein KDJ27_20490 [Gammaproteobacteria bacterium]|nr:hypothetical protein [Gammaproteobacteria bacterium]MCB1926080.1 hypothetical protein [Gammaproteobacteria bacterium]